MSIVDLWNSWKRFWFSPESSFGVSVFRIVYGLVVLECCLLMYPDLLNFFGTHAICSLQSSQQILEVFGPPGLNVFTWFPFSDSSVIILFWILTAAAVSLTLGFHTRISAIAVYVALASFQQQDCLIMNGGDILLKMTAFYLIFSPAGDYLSLDALRNPQRQNHFPSGWPQNMYRFLIALIYFQAFWSKLEDKTWLDGSAIYLVLRQQEFLRFPVDWIANNIWLCQSLTWGTLIIECAMWSLVWFKQTRYFVLAGALLLHLGIEYTMNLPIFEGLMIAALIVFVPPQDLKYVYDKMRTVLLRAFCSSSVLSKPGFSTHQ